MIRLAADRLLERNGKTKYWLGKQLGTSWQNVTKMLENKTQSIRYSTIESLCQLFDCTPNDLFEIDADKPEGNQDGEA